MAVTPREPRRNDTDVQARWAPVFPARTTRLLRYSSSSYLAGTSGVVASNVLAANGLYDPEITGSGHQPMGFDQLMLSYNHYTVTSCRLVVTFHNLAASTPTVSLKVDGGSTPSTVADTIVEFGLNTHSTLEAKSTFGACKVLEQRVSIRKFEGVKDVMDVVDLRGSVAANPAELTYFHVQCWDNTGTTTNVLCEIVMEFSAVFTEPRMLTPSLSGLLKTLVVAEAAQTESSDEKHCQSGVVFHPTPLVARQATPVETVDYYSPSGKWLGCSITGVDYAKIPGVIAVPRKPTALWSSRDPAISGEPETKVPGG